MFCKITENVTTLLKLHHVHTCIISDLTRSENVTTTFELCYQPTFELSCGVNGSPPNKTTFRWYFSLGLDDVNGTDSDKNSSIDYYYPNEGHVGIADVIFDDVEASEGATIVLEKDFVEQHSPLTVVCEAELKEIDAGTNIIGLFARA